MANVFDNSLLLFPHQFLRSRAAAAKRRREADLVNAGLKKKCAPATRRNANKVASAAVN